MSLVKNKIILGNLLSPVSDTKSHWLPNTGLWLEKTRGKSEYKIKVIQKNANYLQTLIEDAIDFSRLSTKQNRIEKNRVCIVDLLSEIQEMFLLKSQNKKTKLEFIFS